MDRRDFLGGVTALFAAGLVMDEAEAAGPPPTTPHEVEPWLETLDQDLQRMSQQAPTEGVREALHEAGLPPTLLGETFATLSLLAAWRDSDEEVRQHPAFQGRLFRAADALARRCVVMADWMEGVDRQRRRAIGALLSRPNRLMAVLDHVLIRKGERMNAARRRALRGTLGDLARATRKAGAKPETLVDELIGFVDHAAREEGVDRHALATQERTEQTSASATSVTIDAEDEPGRFQTWFNEQNKVVRLGLRLMGLAVGLVLANLCVAGISILVANAVLSVGVLIVSVVCVAPLLFVTGLMLVVVGRLLDRWHAREEATAEDEALLYLLSPFDPLSPQPA